MHIEKSKRIFGLDLLRAIAISLVVVSHATYILFPDSENSIITLVRIFGAIGVDLFFVLSGFLIGGILLKLILNDTFKYSNLKVFWKRRWLRTLPNYFLILIINILLCLSYGYTLPKNIISYFFFLQNFSTPHPNFFTEAWSLSIEEFAYMLLPAILYLSLLLSKNINKAKVFIGVTLSIMLLLFVLKLHYYFNTEIDSYKAWSATYRKIVLYRLDAIYIGFIMVCFTQLKKTFMQRFKTMFLVLGILILLLLHLIIFWFNLLPQTHLLFYVFIYLFAIGLSLALVFPYFSELNYSGIGEQSTTFISKISYSIYLINYSIVLLSLKHFFEFSDMSFLSRIGMLILFLGLTIVLSTCVYQLFERPILRYRNRTYPS